MKSMISSVLVCLGLAAPSAFADRIVHPRFSEDRVEAKTTASSEGFGILEIRQKGNTVEFLLHADRDSDDRSRGGALRLFVTTRDEKTAEILAEAFDWTTEVSIIVLADLTSGSRWVIPQNQVLFEDVDGALAGGRGHGQTQVMTLDELVKAVNSNS